ncbi:MAG TPA: hypothetical protein ENK75_03590 [Saprospiraceae bacterium]|nr:hypothetical protein [Saprospiraceae bacterium]
MKKTIMITSVGSLVGKNILDSLHANRENLRIIATNSAVEAAENFRCDKTFLVPLTENEKAFIDQLMNIINEEHPKLVIPGRDDDIVILARLKELMPEHKEIFLTGSEKFAHIMDNKVESYKFAQQYGLPFAPTIQSATQQAKSESRELIEKFGFPLIAKPSKGNGSRGIWIVLNQEQLDNIIEKPDFALQPLFGQRQDIQLDTTLGIPFFWEIPEKCLHAVQVLITKDGKVGPSLGFISEMVGGKCERVDLCEDPELLETANKFAECAAQEGWRGTFNIQLKKDPKYGFQAIEMNGRFSGGTSARYYLGFDEVTWILKDWLGDDALISNPVPEGIQLVKRSLCDYGLKKSDMEILKTDKVWNTSE